MPTFRSRSPRNFNCLCTSPLKKHHKQPRNFAVAQKKHIIPVTTGRQRKHDQIATTLQNCRHFCPHTRFWKTFMGELFHGLESLRGIQNKKNKKNIQSISFWLRRRGSFNSACHFPFFLWRLSFKSCHRRPSCQLATPALAGLTSSRAENFNSPPEGASTKISGGCIFPAAVVEITKRARQMWRRGEGEKKTNGKKKRGVKV